MISQKGSKEKVWWENSEASMKNPPLQGSRNREEKAKRLTLSRSSAERRKTKLVSIAK